jgi:hypothetical protein
VNTEQRQLLYDALMADAPNKPDELNYVVELADIVTHDIDVIEPLIDAMLDAARQGSAPTDWKFEDIELNAIREGTNVLLDIKVGIRRFSVSVEREKIKILCDMLIKEAGF